LKVKDRLIIIFAIVLILMVSTRALFSERPSLNVSAALIAAPLGVYWDAPRTKPVTSVDWGDLTVGETKTTTMYVQNEGNERCTLSVTMANWQAANKSNIATFSCQEPAIMPGQTVQINPSLTIFSNASGVSSFSFDIVFTATLTPPLNPPFNPPFTPPFRGRV
jgi:hypothetical protein